MSSEHIIHLSIDDVWQSLNVLKDKSDGSIFDVPFFSYLRYLHKEYNIRVTLYVVGKQGEFDIWKFPRRYRSEFIQNSDWMKFALHCSVLSSDVNIAMANYLHYSNQLEEVVGKESMSSIVRLHGFSCDVSEFKKISSRGIGTLLCADDERISYDMTENEYETLKERGVFVKNSIRYIPTAIRLEKRYNLHSIIQKSEAPFISVFTHEYYFYGRKLLIGKAMMNKFMHICVKENVCFCN